MAEAKLILHCGARHVDRSELSRVPTPAPTETWFPVAHSNVIDTVERSLGDAGFVVRSSQFGLSRNDARMFAVLKLEAALIHGISLAVGIRNSLDKSLPMGFIAGNSVFTCDNLAFRSELMVKRKHTRFGEARYAEAIAQAVQSLSAFKQAETQRIRTMQQIDLSEDRADALLLRAYEARLVSHRKLPDVIAEWRRPSFDDFQDRTLWSMFNAFTTVLGSKLKSNPQQFAALTMQLNGLMDAQFPALLAQPPVIIDAVAEAGTTNAA